VGYVYRIGVLSGFFLGVVFAVGIALTVDAIDGGELPWITAAIIAGCTLWVGPAFSEIYARIFVPHYKERSFATFAGTLTFWVAIVFSLLAIVLLEENQKTIVLLNVLATLLIGYLIPVAYNSGFAGGKRPAVG
jgi:hypothetical protein